MNESGFVIERSTDNGATLTQLATAGPRTNTGTVTYVDSAVTLGSAYVYRVRASNLAGSSAWSNSADVLVDVPVAPVATATAAASSATRERITVSWPDLSNETSYRVEWSASPDFAVVAGSANLAANAMTYTTGNLAKQTWYVRVRGSNVLGSSAWSSVVAVNPAP